MWFSGSRTGELVSAIAYKCQRHLGHSSTPYMRVISPTSAMSMPDLFVNRLL